jgi:CRP-like cAMP-binding protein
MNQATSALNTELSELLPAALHGLCARVVLGKGETLFQAGKKPGFMFFVLHGEVTLERLGANGETTVLQRARHGFVAEASLLSARYHCDARAVANSEVARIPLRELRGAMEHDGAFALRWISMLNGEVKRLRLQNERLALNGVRHRLMHLITTEGTQNSYPLGAGLKSLAKELGVTHEALYRCVAALEKSGELRRDAARLYLA